MTKRELIANIFLQFGFPILALLLGLLCCILLPFLTSAPNLYLIITLLFLAAGFLMFLKAKLSLITRGNLLSFGPKQMSKPNRILYLLGYLFLAAGLILALIPILFYPPT
jgi:hypothetical protein